MTKIQNGRFETTDEQAIEHFKRTGAILPGHVAAVSAWIAEHNGGGE